MSTLAFHVFQFKIYSLYYFEVLYMSCMYVHIYACHHACIVKIGLTFPFLPHFLSFCLCGEYALEQSCMQRGGWGVSLCQSYICHHLRFFRLSLLHSSVISFILNVYHSDLDLKAFEYMRKSFFYSFVYMIDYFILHII